MNGVLIRAVPGSVTETAMVPLEDVLGLGGGDRIDFPGRPSGNWCQRCTPDMLAEPICERLAELTRTYGRGLWQSVTVC